ncbi:MAG: bifunctional diaminohydroxyphosphoribosylaminopyrimidine deaminase/5-amino-6-(5-phosphoribosylamino)uracil reductase RibD [Candidatus Levybacteria bacterium]|nr:bifunctional diaminohydroxyphosphoribosylaminopyrimidine deaminase/5-amino-6-(5-phosphoribosylamino)uracil reductase RibD [Candidatus Levybacteria bacterium]
MEHALKLAKKGLGFTNPNPMVGAVIVKNDRIIAEGYYHKAGFPHAEVEAIHAAKQNIKGATLYCNLEPCAHFGRTPPCVTAIIKAGIKRTVYATTDPNPKVAGKSKKILRQAGITVMERLLEEKAKKLNEAFFTFHEKKRPFIIIKFAASLDGKIATYTGDSKWITNEKSRKRARELRGAYQAVCVGINTVIKDNPHLGVREKGKRDPLRIILDPSLKISLGAKALRDKNVLIVTTKNTKNEKMRQLANKEVSCILFDEAISLRGLMDELYKREIVSLLVEGGGETLGHFVDKQLVDKAYIFLAPILIGGKTAISSIQGKGAKNITSALRLKDTKQYTLDSDYLIVGYV